MSDLRLYLLFIGLGLIAGVYIWGTLQSRKQQRQQTIQQPQSGHDSPAIKTFSTPDAEIDYSSALAGLNQSMSQTKSQQTDLTSDLNYSPIEAGIQKEDSSIDIKVSSGERQNIKLPYDEEPSNTSGNTGQQIITLHISLGDGELISGQTLLQTLQELDMEIGPLNIFHHYGVGEMKMDEPLFSLANILEPGVFDVENMENFATPGLTMFMTLPGIIDGQVVFELMLNTAFRLAALLKADVCDEKRILLDEEKIEIMRTSITVQD